MDTIKSNILRKIFTALLFIALSFPVYSINNWKYLLQDEKHNTELYTKGLQALNNKDTINAEKYFKESISKNGDAASYYELAKIYLVRNTHLSRNIAYEYFRKAALIEPENLEYRYAFANLMKSFARRSSMKEYKNILSLDSNQTNAYLNLGEMKAKDFNEFNRSVRSENGVYMSMQEAANKDFVESEKYFLSALSKDTLNYDTIMKLSLLYERANKPQKGIPLLNRLVRNNKDDKNVHLLLGLLYYKTSQLQQSHNEYKIALELMDKLEKLDFTRYSVLLTLNQSDLFENSFIDEENAEQIINSFWKASDPLYLTDYNERLLEHYSRVAYANLNFSVPSLGLAGWSTDMGETVVRYGEPLNRIRIRPAIGAGGTVSVKTELWYYENMNVAFTDMFSNGNYQYVWPAGEKDKLVPQIPGNYLDFMNDLKRNNPTFYKPKYEGPTLSVPYFIAQFKSARRNYTDLFLNYFFPEAININIDSVNYKIGFFLFDKKFTEKFKSVFNLKTIKSNKSLQSMLISLQPDSGYAAFELIRDVDKGTFSSHGNFTVKKFSNTRLDISDLLIAVDISLEKKGEEYFNRNEIYIKPYIQNEFTEQEPIYLYYEIYNLEKDNQGLTDFEQSLVISDYSTEQKSVLSKLFSSITNFLGITSEQKITLKSNYKTLETNPQIYFQLDLNNFDAGEYQIKIVIKDNLNGSEKEVDRIIKLLK